MVLPNGGHHQHAFRMSKKERKNFYSYRSLDSHHVRHGKGASVQLAEAISLSMNPNTGTAIDCAELSFVDIMRVSYAMLVRLRALWCEHSF